MLTREEQLHVVTIQSSVFYCSVGKITPVLDISHRNSSKNTLKQVAKKILKRKESKETCHVNNPNARSDQNLQTETCFKNKPEQVINASTQTHIDAFDH